ncbi:hypothetical protein BDV93DRAFT_452252, partial [Ceratobasidium sp. AG-I]
AMERANGIVSKINHNGKTTGISEGNLMRDWRSYAMLQNLVSACRIVLAYRYPTLLDYHPSRTPRPHPS